MIWTAATIHVLDFEGSRRSGVVEFGVATLSAGKITATHTRLCAPAGPLSAGETALHGLREADIAAAAPFAEEQSLFANLRQNGLLAAHHAPIERSLLRRAWPVPPAAPDFAEDDPGAAPRLADWGPWLDTRLIYENLYPAQPSYRLMDLVGSFELQNDLLALAATYCPPHRRRPHCALYDALAATLLLRRLASEPALATASLARFVALSSSPSDETASSQSELLLEE